MKINSKPMDQNFEIGIERAHVSSQETPQNSFKNTLSNMLQSLEKDFEVSSKAISRGINRMPEEYKSMYQIQVQVSHMQFKIETITRIADGAQSSIKKLQQQN